jgi:hypothetical protein
MESPTAPSGVHPRQSKSLLAGGIRALVVFQPFLWMFGPSMMKTLLIVSAAFVTTALAEPPQTIPVEKLRGTATLVDDVVVPVPTEIFAVLDKIGKPRWREVLRPQGKVKSPGPREQTALLLGTVIAEGFIAVEAEDAEEVKNIGRSVLTLSEALSVRKVVVPRSNAIIQGADKKAWSQVKRELDKAQKEVQEAMRELNDEALSQLVSLGGWMRGTEALATVVTANYTKDGAELLHQPILVDYFTRKLENTKYKDKALVEKLRTSLREIRPLMGTEGAVISEKSVGEMKAITERLTTLFHAKNP